LGPNAQALRELAQVLLESRVDALRDQGLVVLAHALSLHPQDASLWLLRGTHHATLFQHEAARADFKQALTLEPALEEAHCAAACSLAALGQPEQALQELRARVAVAEAAEAAEAGASQHPVHAEPRPRQPRQARDAALRHKSQAFVLRTQGWLVEAEDALRRALADDAASSTEWSLGAVLLTQGRYAEGWAVWRRLGLAHGQAAWLWHQALAQGARPWDGSVATAVGRTLLVVAENGLGDTVQFARFLPALQAQGVQISSHLLTMLPYVATIVVLALISRNAAFIRVNNDNII
jgi:tetratricopeptide (TPR) repeat protein